MEGGREGGREGREGGEGGREGGRGGEGGREGGVLRTLTSAFGAPAGALRSSSLNWVFLAL